MSSSLFSPSWYRVAGLKPRLRSHAQIHRHFYRGQLWYVIQNHATGRFHRFSPEAYLIIGLLDGKHTLDEIWRIAAENRPITLALPFTFPRKPSKSEGKSRVFFGEILTYTYWSA